MPVTRVGVGLAFEEALVGEGLSCFDGVDVDCDAPVPAEQPASHRSATSIDAEERSVHTGRVSSWRPVAPS